MTSLTLAWVAVGFVSEAKASDEQIISATMAGYSPSSLVIETGTTVTWRNDEPVPTLTTAPTGAIGIKHHARSPNGEIDSGDLLPGQSFAATFNEPGTFEYVCVRHPSTMTGSLTVEGDPIVPPTTEKTVRIIEPSQTSAWGYDPKDLEVAVGTTITWRNAGAEDHTATAEDGSFDTGMLGAGEAAEVVFETSGYFSYKCEPHPWMTGAVVVVEPGKAPPIKPKPRPQPKSPTDAPPPVAVPERTGNQPTTFDAQMLDGDLSSPDTWGYRPEAMTVREGDTVVWTNLGAIDHSVTALDADFDSGLIEPGGKFSLTFDEVGTFAYACTPHPWMTGAVAVIEPDGDLTSASKPEVPKDNSASPQDGSPVIDAPPGSTPDHPIAVSGGFAGWSVGNLDLATGAGGLMLALLALFMLPFANDLRRSVAASADLHQRTTQKAKSDGP